MTAAQADHEKITRDDLEGKFRELAGDVTWSQGQIRGPRVLPVRVLATA